MNLKENITVYILSYNRPNYLDEAIKSVIELGIKKNDIVILDNASDDDKVNLIKEKYKSDVLWHGAAKNNGVGWNISRSMTISSKDYFLLLHDDDKLCKNFLEVQSKYLQDNHNLIALSCNGYKINEKGMRNSSLLLNLNEEKGIDYFNDEVDICINALSNSCIPMSPIIYKKEKVYNIISNFNKIYSEFKQCSDVGLLLKISEKGSVGLNRTPLYECRSHEGQDSNEMHYESILSMIKYCYKISIIKNNKVLKTKVKEFYTIYYLHSVKKCITSFHFFKLSKMIMNIKIKLISLSKPIKLIREKLVLSNNSNI